MSMLKRPLYFPRCFVCDSILWLRDFLGRKKEVVVCRCGARYNRTFIKDADPDAWERVRLTGEFYITKGPLGEPQVFLRSGVGSRRKVI